MRQAGERGRARQVGEGGREGGRERRGTEGGRAGERERERERETWTKRGYNNVAAHVVPLLPLTNPQYFNDINQQYF